MEHSDDVRFRHAEPGKVESDIPAAGSGGGTYSYSATGVVSPEREQAYKTASTLEWNRRLALRDSELLGSAETKGAHVFTSEREPASETAPGGALSAIAIAVGGTALVVDGLKRGDQRGVLLAFGGGVMALLGVNRLLEGGIDRLPRRRDALPGTRGLDPDLTEWFGDFSSRPVEVEQVEVARKRVASTRFEEMMETLIQALTKTFPLERYLAEEVEGIVQALVSTLRRSIALLVKKQIAERGSFQDPVTEFVTAEGFANEFVGRRGFISAIRHTSGIGDEEAAVALDRLEAFIRAGLQQADELNVEHIGSVREHGRGFHIRLADELQRHPYHLAGIR